MNEVKGIDDVVKQASVKITIAKKDSDRNFGLLMNFFSVESLEEAFKMIEVDTSAQLDG